ncbi:FBD-associated F-box protein [Trifolium repens]|nr:FBD-associated F-box protein [Trifolium repens]
MEQVEDRLSNLPKVILHNILSRLPEEDAARTSVLSKVWQEAWYTFPNLSFCDSHFIGKSIYPVEDISGLSKKRKDFIDYVKSRLARFWKQRFTIKEFKLSVICFELGYMSRDVNLWLKLASESGVEVLELRNGHNKDEEGRGECYVLPKSVIEVKTLIKLVLEGRIRVDQSLMNHSSKFFSLRELHLVNIVHLEEDEQAIERLISCCPLIEIIFLIFCGGRMKSLSMHGLQKLKKVVVDGIKKVYIDEASTLKSLYYGHYCLDAPFKIDYIQCKYFKHLLLRLNSTTIITTKWFLELFPKFQFLETLEILNCVLSEKINISSVQLKHLEVSDCSKLEEANIDAPNLLSCKFSGFGDSEPIISFSNISSKLEVCVNLYINDDFDIFDVRDILQNIKPQNVISLSLVIMKPIMDAPSPMFLDISPPPIKHLDLCIYPTDYEITLFSDLLHFLLLCCCPTTISFSLDTSTRAFIEFFYEKLMRRKDDKCFCSSNDTKCWWHDLKDVKVINSMKIDENIDLKTVLDSFEAWEKISLILEF